MVRLFSLGKCAAVAIATIITVEAGVEDQTISLPLPHPEQTRSLSNAKQICLACKLYASDNDGNFPPSLDALFPTYLTDRAILASPLQPGDPIGYTYTPGLKDTSPAGTVVIEDKFAPLRHIRIVACVDDSARIIKIP